MFVMTAKLSKPKLLAAGLIIIAVIAAIVMLVTGNSSTPAAPLPKGATDADRAAYLATYGWSINAQPKETQTVTIPDTVDNKVFARYNDLQLSQGFDLKSYAGMKATRFVYEILNYPRATAPVYAGVLVYEGHIIGGEITDTSPNGVIHGFRKPGSDTPADTDSPSASEMAPEHPTVPADPTATEPTAPADPTTAQPSAPSEGASAPSTTAPNQ